MPYQGPMLIREPEVRWPLILVAAAVTALMVVATAGVFRLSLARPARGADPEPRLEGAVRPGAPGFEQLSEKIVVERAEAAEAPRAPDDFVVELSGTLRNNTGRTVSGLEVRGAVLDAQGAAVRERTVVVVPARQAAVEPGEAIKVRIPLEGFGPEAERAAVLMEVTGVRVE